MSSQILMTLLITIVLFHIVQVVASNDDGALHLGGHYDTTENTTADGDISSEGTLLVNIGTTDGLLGGLEAKANVLVPAGSLALGDDTLIVQEDGLLLLETALVLSQWMSISHARWAQ